MFFTIFLMCCDILHVKIREKYVCLLFVMIYARFGVFTTFHTQYSLQLLYGMVLMLDI